ncbi:hypothetical protein CI102_10572 [Trichoderma harzianum]|nr:hypothetical protein CI102_10572 [Trichoderma harzianum]
MYDRPPPVIRGFFIGLGIYNVLVFSALSGWMIYLVIKGLLFFDPRYVSSFIKKIQKGKLPVLYAAFLDTLLIIRFFAWIEQLKLNDQSMNIIFCYGCIVFMIVELPFRLLCFLYEVWPTTLWRYLLERIRSKGSRETNGNTERGDEMITEARI